MPVPTKTIHSFPPPMHSLSDPMAILYERIEGTAAWRERGRTEMMLNNEGGGGAHAGGGKPCPSVMAQTHMGGTLCSSAVTSAEGMPDNEGGMATEKDRTLLN